jgi:serine/threonine-protein kinase
VPRHTHERIVLDLVERALEWPEHERAARLDEIVTDAALRDRVLALVDGNGSAAIPDEPSRSFFDWRLPSRIGPYRLAESLGEGGMGLVFRGERDDGLFEQTVAIKLMRPGLISAELSRRFADERRILARLAHPGIAQLFDGGADEHGNSFIVMEYVRGRTITAYCRERTLGRTRELALFEQMCDAVQAAHQQLVVHADIKPGNVLVTDDGRVKLLDFGIARILERQTTESPNDDTPLTRGYAAPERLAGQAPTIASDVYSLGAMLQELVGADASKELDAIVRRACAHRPEERYPTVAALIADLGAWRSHRPVAAVASAGSGYRFRKFLRRNRIAVAATVAFATLLIGATVVTRYQYDEAVRARADADRRFDETRTMSKYMLFSLFDQLAAIPGTLSARQNLAATAQNYLDELAAHERAPFDVRLETAQGYIRLGAIQGGYGRPNLGDVDGFRQNYAKASALLEELRRVVPDRADVWLTYAGLETDRAFQAMNVDNAFDDAARRLGEADHAVGRVRTLAPESVEAADLEWVLATYRIDLMQWLNRQEEAIAAGERALAMAEQLPASIRDSAVFPSRLAALFRRQGETLQALGRAEDAVAMHRRAVASAREGIERQSGSLRSLLSTSICEWDLGRALLDARALDESLVHLDAAAALSRRTLEMEPDNDQLLRTDMINASDRALTLSALGRHSEALESFATVLARATARVAAEPEDQGRARDLIEQRKISGQLMIAAGNVEAGCAQLITLLPELEALKAEGRLSAYDTEALLADVERRAKRDCSS